MDVVLNDELCCCVWADRPLSTSRAWGQCSAAGLLCTAFDWGTPLPQYPIEPSFTDTLVEQLSKWAALCMSLGVGVCCCTGSRLVLELNASSCASQNSLVSLSMFIYIL